MDGNIEHYRPQAAAVRTLRPKPSLPRRRGRQSDVGMFLLGGLLRRIIRKGTLTVVAPDHRAYRFGRGDPSVTMRIADPATVWRLVRNPDLALSEGYMDGTIFLEGGGIYDLLDLCLANLGGRGAHLVRRVRALGRRLVRRLAQHNPVSVARANVAHHYDLSDELYGLFLDASRQYSCAYYAAPDDTLEQAQQRKMRHIAAKLLLAPGQRVLDIGSGWGGLALHLASAAEVDVTGVTLSTEQHRDANRRADEAGLAERVRFRLKDYRYENGRYDRIVSVGMFEHVGVGHYREYFEKVRDLLAEDGVALIHTIGRTDGPGSTNAWIRKYIFPGGYTPALSEIVPVVERAGLHITDVEVLRLHYAETLRAWRMRFLAQRDRAADIYDERFCRMWEFYLAGCEAAFRHGGLVVFQIQLSKRIEAVPLTRDYIAAGERAQETRPLAPGMADIAVRESAGRGRGVFAARAFRKGETIEVCPVVALSESEARNLDRTPLYDYYFGWGEGGKGAAIVMGYGSIYNHSRTPNAVYRKNEQDGTITFTAARAISAGEEILIRYNTGSRESPDRMWFEVA